jgi:FkbM family methyltransferase
MTWIPQELYSQNYEDLYLWRIFRHKPQGFYIDVGAYDPNVDSVTKIFYDQGWSGINIEPVSSFIDKLKLERPRDINLAVAAAGSSGKRILHLYGDSGLSSLDLSCQSLIQDSYRNQHYTAEVATKTLFEIINSYAPPSIDFLKIDVEGLEEEVLDGLCLSKLPKELWPRIILVEATATNTRLDSESRKQCGCLLRDAGYESYFFDGLNDYYCMSNELEKCRRLSLPPNVFDEIPVTPRYSAQLRNEVSELHAMIKNANDEVRNSQQRLDDLLSAHKIELARKDAEHESKLLNQLSNSKNLSLSREIQLKDLAARTTAEINALQQTNQDLGNKIILLREQVHDLQNHILKSTCAINTQECELERLRTKLAWNRAQCELRLILLNNAIGSFKKLISLTSRLLCAVGRV